MDSRLELGKYLLRDNGLHCTTIDDFEYHFLKELLDQTFLKNYLGTIAIRINPSGRPTPNGFAISHEYGIFHSKNPNFKLRKFERTEELNKRYKEEDADGIYMWELLRKRGSNSDRSDRPKMYYPFYIKGKSLRLPQMQWIEEMKTWQIDEGPEPDEIVVYPIDEDGMERNWRLGVETIVEQLSELRVEKGKNGSTTVYYKYRPPVSLSPTTTWIDSKYSATEHGTGVVKGFFTDYNPFSFPKSIHAVQDCIYLAGLSNNDITLDYFAGSGTTAHAVINLNREDGGSRKYILVEMGAYFDTVTKPRVQKVIYSEDWKDGKPVSRKGSSHAFKYLRLESYEDTLNNLALRQSAEQQTLLGLNDIFGEQYLLSYMLDTETAGSLLSVDTFDNPFEYQLRIIRDNEAQPTRIDLVETFNYLIGLKVATTQRIRGFHVVTGENLQGEQILVIWRNRQASTNADLDEFFRKMNFSTRDREFDRIYVNGDNNLQNLKTGDEKWKVALIEEEFLKRMFEVEDV